MSKCNRCNRNLKDPVSIQRGYGKVCYAKMMADRESREESGSNRMLDEKQYPLDEAIVCMRDERGTMTNVPWIVKHHSPTGYEFGYGGSGPADLALNIVENLLRRIGYDGEKTNDVWDKSRIFVKAYELHQDFKWAFVASLPRDGGSIKTNTAIAWIEAHLETQKSLF